MNPLVFAFVFWTAGGLILAAAFTLRWWRMRRRTRRADEMYDGQWGGMT